MLEKAAVWPGKLFPFQAVEIDTDLVDSDSCHGQRARGSSRSYESEGK